MHACMHIGMKEAHEVAAQLAGGDAQALPLVQYPKQPSLEETLMRMLSGAAQEDGHSLSAGTDGVLWGEELLRGTGSSDVAFAWRAAARLGMEMRDCYMNTCATRLHLGGSAE